MPMLSVREAIELMLPRFAPVGTEHVSLSDAFDRVVAGPVTVANDLPEFDHSAMDGYAFRWGDADKSPATLPVSAELKAGDRPQPLAANTAVRIFTGAPLPDGADTVVMQEDTDRAGASVTLQSVPARGSHVRARGSELQAGARLFEPGTPLGPAEIGLLASQGYALVEVFRRPRVAILATGNELRALSEPRTPFTIVDSNTYALSAALKRAGCIPVPLAIARDDREAIRASVEHGLTHDALITVGGVSVGDYDFVSEALRAASVSVEFHKVAIKPGKPVLFGQRDQTPVIGLPGNPVSALVVFEIFVRPGLLRMQGRRDLFPEPVEVTLATGYARKPGRMEFVRARLRYEAGTLVATVHPHQGSASMSSLTAASALVVVPAERGQLLAGDRLKAILPALPGRADPAFAD